MVKHNIRSPRRWRDHTYAWLGIINIGKVKVILKEVNALSCLMGKITVIFFEEFEKMTLHIERKWF